MNAARSPRRRPCARECGEPFFLALAPRLEAPAAAARRVLLDVGFVRQHHQTCARATIAALARFWEQPGEHLEVAEAICYDGTPDHRQRCWAERNGWLPREFTVTWDSARALLDRGVPFTLATVETQSAHLQAVIGYDARRGTLLIRDPTLPYSGEALAEALLERYRSVGPRGMAMVPADRADLLEGLDLPEAPLYDHLHHLQVALHEHDRGRAAAAYDALCAAGPGHRLVLHARCVLAHYDADTAELLAGVEAQLELFPNDVNLRLSQLSCLRLLGRRDERLAVYRELCDRPAADPLLRRQYAQELLVDAREHPTVVRLLGRALRVRPLDPPGLAALAEVARDGRRLAEAVELYRFAACLDDKDEGLARTYFQTVRYLHREDEALRFLEGRFRRYGTRSSWPARTLCWALAELERKPEAFAVLEEALRLRPDDGDLLMFVAEGHAAHGEFDRAAERLDAAQGHCRRGDWLRSAAYLAAVRGDLAGSLDLWRQVLQAEPVALDANLAVAKRLAETEGRAVALEHLAQACDRSPYNFPLHQARIEWLREDGPAAAEPAVRRLLANHPDDAWARRELALVVARQSRHEEAAGELQLATLLEPASTNEASVRGQVLELAGQRAEAQEAYRESIRRSADNSFAIGRLIENCDSRAERVEALAFIEEELVRQVLFGEGLLAFAQRAGGRWIPTSCWRRSAKPWRPGPTSGSPGRPWSMSWSSATSSTRRWTWRGGQPNGSPCSPGSGSIWPPSAGRVGTASASSRRWTAPCGSAPAGVPRSASARRRSRRRGTTRSRAPCWNCAVAHAPLDVYNHGFLADALWRLGEKEPALERLLHALRLDPDYDWAWNALSDWAPSSIGRSCRSTWPASSPSSGAARPGTGWPWPASSTIPIIARNGSPPWIAPSPWNPATIRPMT